MRIEVFSILNILLGLIVVLMFQVTLKGVGGDGGQGEEDGRLAHVAPVLPQDPL